MTWHPAMWSASHPASRWSGTLLDRFERTGDITALHGVVDAARQAVEAGPSGDFPLAGRLWFSGAASTRGSTSSSPGSGDSDLVHHGELRADDAAPALHRAVHRPRDAFRDRPSVWTPFAHTGP